VKNRIEDLRNHLFAALESLADKDSPMEIERAKAISDVAQTIINSAKVEVELLRALGGDHPGTGFIPVAAGEPQPPRPQLVEGRRQ
jgi:hypothetical protein